MRQTDRKEWEREKGHIQFKDAPYTKVLKVCVQKNFTPEEQSSVLKNIRESMCYIPAWLFTMYLGMEKSLKLSKWFIFLNLLQNIGSMEHTLEIYVIFALFISLIVFTSSCPREAGQQSIGE